MNNKKLTDAEFDAIVARDWSTLNRRERRLIQNKREAMKELMSRSKNTSYESIQSIAGTTVTNELRGK